MYAAGKKPKLLKTNKSNSNKIIPNVDASVSSIQSQPETEAN